MTIPVLEAALYSDSGASASPMELTKVSGVVPGDLLAIVVSNKWNNHDNPMFSDNLPGWTLQWTIDRGVNNSTYTALYTRWASGAEDATTTIVPVEQRKWLGWYMRFSGAGGLDDYTLFFQTVTTTSHVIPEIVTTINDALAIYGLMFFGGDGAPYTEATTGWTEIDDQAQGTGSADISGAIGTKGMATAGATGDALVTSTVADRAGYYQFSVAPLEDIAVYHVGDNFEHVDDGETGIAVTVALAEAVQGTGKVEFSDDPVYANGTKVEQTVTAWADNQITIEVSLGALDPGTAYAWVTNDSGERNAVGFVIALHRAQAFILAASSNIAASGEDTTAQLTAPSGKTSGANFGGGRIQKDENPGDVVDLALDDYREDEWPIEPLPAAELATYEFRVVSDGIPVFTYSVTPELTVEEEEEDPGTPAAAASANF